MEEVLWIGGPLNGKRQSLAGLPIVRVPMPPKGWIEDYILSPGDLSELTLDFVEYHRKTIKTVYGLRVVYVVSDMDDKTALNMYEEFEAKKFARHGYGTADPAKAADILEKAAEILERDEWIQGGMHRLVTREKL